MKIHDLVLIAELLGQLEKETHLESTVLEALFALSLGFTELSESIQTARLVDEDLLVLFSALDELVINTHGLAKGKKETHRMLLKSVIVKLKLTYSHRCGRRSKRHRGGF